MASIDEILNFVVPAVLILIAAGFLYTKFIGPWVVPMLAKLWGWISGSSEEIHISKRKEISYGGETW